jgi:hypothetical protein
MKVTFFIRSVAMLAIVLFGSTMVAHPVYAQTSLAPCTNCNLGYVQLEPIPGIALTSGNNPNDPNSLINPNNLYKIINAIFTILITGGALMAVLSLTLGGIQYMTSASAGGKNSGIKRAQAAMWAMLLIAGTWLTLHTINPKLLTFSLNPCPNGVQGINCNINSNLSNGGGTTSAAPLQATLTQDQINQQGLSGKLQNTDSLQYNTGNLPSSSQVQQFDSSCASKGGKTAGMGVSATQAVFVCETPTAYSADPANQFNNAGSPLP